MLSLGLGLDHDHDQWLWISCRETGKVEDTRGLRVGASLKLISRRVRMMTRLPILEVERRMQH